jgi:NCS1 family nucleobase:cation symporter-1
MVYLIGFGVEVPFVNTTFYEGPVARALSGTDLSWLVGLVVTIPLYYVLAMRRVRSESRAAVTVTAS